LTLAALGPRTSVVALVAGALEPELVERVELRQAYGSLKQVIERNLSFESAPELFCFGLLEQFDIPQLGYLVRDARVERR
jgi:hypothetical protein